MKSCREYEEMAILDVHGELDPGAQVLWERHLRDCPACREERLALTEMLREVRETLRHPSVTPGQSEILVKTVRARLSREKKGARGWMEFFFRHPRRLLPALASLCVVFIVLYAFGLRTVGGPTRVQTESDFRPWSELKAEDIEIIRNMDLLRDLDWVQRLVQAIDESDNGTPTSQMPGQWQGGSNLEGRRGYA
jgi:hypothetical protein